MRYLYWEIGVDLINQCGPSLFLPESGGRTTAIHLITIEQNQNKIGLGVHARSFCMSV